MNKIIDPFDKIPHLEQLKWADEIPWMQFPEAWEVKIIPPFTGAVVRFFIRTKKMPPGQRISVYLDCYNALGYFNGPYWEAYPIEDSTFRCGIQEYKLLFDTIEAELKRNNWI